jgi:hypothetical protein
VLQTERNISHGCMKASWGNDKLFMTWNQYNTIIIFSCQNFILQQDESTSQVRGSNCHWTNGYEYLYCSKTLNDNVKKSDRITYLKKVIKKITVLLTRTKMWGISSRLNFYHVNISKPMLLFIFIKHLYQCQI